MLKVFSVHGVCVRACARARARVCVCVWGNPSFHNSKPLTIFTKFCVDGISL